MVNWLHLQQYYLCTPSHCLLMVNVQALVEPHELILVSRTIQIPQRWGPADSLEREVRVPNHHIFSLFFLFWYPKYMCRIPKYIALCRLRCGFASLICFVFGVWDVFTTKVHEPSGSIAWWFDGPDDLKHAHLQVGHEWRITNAMQETTWSHVGTTNQTLVWEKDFKAWLQSTGSPVPLPVTMKHQSCFKPQILWPLTAAAIHGKVWKGNVHLIQIDPNWSYVDDMIVTPTSLAKRVWAQARSRGPITAP